MNTNFLSIIKRIIAEQGEAILAEPQRLKGLIKDYAQDEPKPERLAFGRCVEYGAYNALKACGTAEERQAVKAALAQRVHDGEGLDRDLCAAAMDIIDAALFGVQTQQQPATQRTMVQAGVAPPSQAVYQPPVYQQPARGNIKENSELRALARQQLHGVWGKMAFVCFIHFLILSPSYLFSFLNSVLNSAYSIYRENNYPTISGISIILSIAVIIVSGPFALGFTNFYLKKIRGENIELKDIFSGFSMFSQSFVLNLLTYIFAFLWSWLLIIPGVFICLVSMELGILIIIAGGILGIIKGLNYALAFYILRDYPDIKPLEAIKKSKIMIAGYKFKFFCLLLSFIGWALLCCLSLGIGFLWLKPYMGLSVANFYENLK